MKKRSKKTTAKILVAEPRSMYFPAKMWLSTCSITILSRCWWKITSACNFFPPQQKELTEALMHRVLIWMRNTLPLWATKWHWGITMRVVSIIKQRAVSTSCLIQAWCLGMSCGALLYMLEGDWLILTSDLCALCQATCTGFYQASAGSPLFILHPQIWNTETTHIHTLKIHTTHSKTCVGNKDCNQIKSPV